MKRRAPLAVLGVVVLGVVLGVILPGMVIGDDVSWPTSENALDSPLTDLVITSHNPLCTAVFLDHLGVTRLTDVKPNRNGTSYAMDEYRDGINVTAVILTSNANGTISAILERPEVSNIVAYPSVLPNATASAQSAPVKAYINLNVEREHSYNHPVIPCDVMSDLITYALMDEVIGWAGSPYPNVTDLVGAAQVTARDDTQNVTAYVNMTLDPRPHHTDLRRTEDGLRYYGDLLSMVIETKNVTETWSYVKRNGAHIIAGGPDEAGSPVGWLGGYVPPSIMWSLMEQDEVTHALLSRIEGMRHQYGNTRTEGLNNEIHSNVENWHEHGYNGTGIKVGVIDLGFDITLANGELPSSIEYCFPDCNNLGSEKPGENRHGTSVAEIVMDMAPGTTLYLAKLDGPKERWLNDATNNLAAQGVDVIVSTTGFPFDGPGDGTSYYIRNPKSTLYAVNKAVNSDIVWVQSAGNEAGGNTWAGNITIKKEGDRKWVIFNPDAPKDKQRIDNWVQPRNNQSITFTSLYMRWAGGGDLEIVMYDENGKEGHVHQGWQIDSNVPSKRAVIRDEGTLRVGNCFAF